MSSIRVGLIGYGGWTRLAFVPALRQHDRVRIVSAAAFSEASQDRIREELGPDVAVYGGFEALLDGPALDAVMIAIPDAIHEAAMNAVLDAGVAAYYEPPLAGSPDGIRRMLKRLVAAGPGNARRSRDRLRFGGSPRRGTVAAGSDRSPANGPPETAEQLGRVRRSRPVPRPSPGTVVRGRVEHHHRPAARPRVRHGRPRSARAGASSTAWSSSITAASGARFTSTSTRSTRWRPRSR